MGLQMLSGWLLILGFILFVVNNTAAPPRLYQESDTELRLKIIAAHPTRWSVAQWAAGFSAIVIGLGFVPFSLGLEGYTRPLLLNIALAAMLLAGIFSLLYIRQVLGDPRAYLEGGGWPPLAVVYIALTMVAGVLFGLIFIEALVPFWLGYLLAVSSASLILLLTSNSKFAYATLFLYYLAILVTGIVLVV